MKNVLIIPPFNPYPLTSGGHQAIFNGIAILKDAANVYMLVDTTESRWKRGEERIIERVLPFVKVIPNIDPNSRHTFRWYCHVLWNKISAKFPKHQVATSVETYEESRMPTIGVDFMSEDKAKEIVRVVRKYHIDIVQVEMISNIRIVDFLPADVKTIFVHHELRFVRDELLVLAQGELTEDIKTQLQQNKDEEIAYLNRYNEVVTLSPIDTEKLRDAGVTTHITTSWAVVSDVVKPLTREKTVSKTLSYVGPENHFPNYDGVMWFLKNCWAKLRAQDSEYSFQIIGKWSDSTVENLANTYENVHCLGFVDNLGEAISGTTMIVPLNIGSGIRMKILEAARIGVPVVATPVGAEGLPLVDGEHAFITANADNFIKDIIALQEESLRRKFVENTRKIIENQYSFEALKRNRIALYE